MFVWMKKRYLYSDDTVGASLDETWSAYKSGKHTNLSGSSLKKGFETLDDKEEDFTQKYFIKKWYFSIKEYFCVSFL